MLTALVITIIVIVILAGMLMDTLAGDNGLLTRTITAKDKTNIEGIQEELQTAIEALKIDYYSNRHTGTIGEYIADHEIDLQSAVGDSTLKVNGNKVTYKGYDFKVDDITGKISEDLITTSVADIFDITGNDTNKLHIGDFVGYTAGKWDETSLAKITASGAKLAPVTNIPTKGFEFGGFGSTANRDGNAKATLSDGFTYVKYTSGKAVTGWRVFDVDTTDNKITLISAGCPEDYYQPFSVKEPCGSISQYILTGDSTGSPSLLNSSSYIPRDWTMYENSSQGAIANSAVALSKTILNEWYSKYVAEGASVTGWGNEFNEIYKEGFEKYRTLIDNYSSYWLASAGDSNSSLYYVSSPDKSVRSDSWKAFGVRVLVSISGVRLKKTTTTKTLMDPRESSKTYTYAYWKIVSDNNENDEDDSYDSSDVSDGSEGSEGSEGSDYSEGSEGSDS